MGDLEPIYCAEQIKVPPALPEILKAWTKQVIREGVPQVSFVFKSCVLERVWSCPRQGPAFGWEVLASVCRRGAVHY